MSHRIRSNVRRALGSFARSTAQSPYGYAFGPMPWIPHDLCPMQEGAPLLDESRRRRVATSDASPPATSST